MTNQHKNVCGCSVDPATMLSPREMIVVKELLKGKTNKEIASTLFVTEKTVKFHFTNIFRKMRVKNRVQLFYVVLSLPGFGQLECN
jgi:DNA-binding NarL/FixJ family response regulator